MTNMRTIELVGAPRERGYHHGRVLRDGIHALYERFIKMMEDVPQGHDGSADRFTEGALLALAREYGPATKDYAPDVYAEMEGIAEGGGLTLLLGDSRRLLAEMEDLLVTTQPQTETILASLDSAAFLLNHFMREVSQRPVRIFTGVPPPPGMERGGSGVTPPDTTTGVPEGQAGQPPDTATRPREQGNGLPPDTTASLPPALTLGVRCSPT